MNEPVTFKKTGDDKFEIAVLEWGVHPFKHEIRRTLTRVEIEQLCDDAHAVLEE